MFLEVQYRICCNNLVCHCLFHCVDTFYWLSSNLSLARQRSNNQLLVLVENIWPIAHNGVSISFYWFYALRSPYFAVMTDAYVCARQRILSDASWWNLRSVICPYIVVLFYGGQKCLFLYHVCLSVSRIIQKVIDECAMKFLVGIVLGTKTQSIIRILEWSGRGSASRIFYFD